MTCTPTSSSTATGAPARPASASTSIDPADGLRHRAVRRRHRRGLPRRRRRRRRRPGSWAATAPRAAQRDPAPRAYEILTDEVELFAELMVRENGKSWADATGRGDLRDGVLPLVRRGGRARPRRLPAVARRRQAHRRRPAADRRLAAHHPVELPRGDGHPQARARRSPPAARRSSSRHARPRSRPPTSSTCCAAPACRAASSTSSLPCRPARSCAPMLAHPRCASCPSPARPRSAASCCASAPTPW